MVGSIKGCCYGCTNRGIDPETGRNCHSVCQKYLAEVAEANKRKESYLQAKMADSQLYQYQRENKDLKLKRMRNMLGVKH